MKNSRPRLGMVGIPVALLIATESLAIKVPTGPDTTAVEMQLKASGFVNIAEVDATIEVDLRYSTKNNFLGEDVYGDFCDCYLSEDVAEKLRNVQKMLRKIYPGLSLLVLDCLRPRSIQRRMWDFVSGKPLQKYVGNPQTGSLHNYGCAVDVTIIDSVGNELDMGTRFDFFDELAQPRLETKFLQEGKLSASQLKNRRLLRETMVKSGFDTISTEWWHFNGLPKDEARLRFSIIE